MDNMDWKRQLKEADMILVGIGEDFEEKQYLQKETAYGDCCEKIVQAQAEWTMPYINRLFLKEDTKLKKAYETLAKLLEGKNYFVLTTCMDGLVRETSLKPERIAEPCGTYIKMQTSDGRADSICATNADVLKRIEACCMNEAEWNNLSEAGDSGESDKMVFNSLYAQHYAEAGYQEEWKTYTKWLQGTLNKKLCILELGSGMMFAGVLRFRFEKIAGLNQKAFFIRVNKNLYQLPVEIAGRGIGISRNAVDFMAETEEIC